LLEKSVVHPGAEDREPPHGGEIVDPVVAKLLLQVAPNLYYSTSAFAPKHTKTTS